MPKPSAAQILYQKIERIVIIAFSVVQNQRRVLRHPSPRHAYLEIISIMKTIAQRMVKGRSQVILLISFTDIERYIQTCQCFVFPVFQYRF